ncbi:MAG: C39 family peptidase [Lachnospirales bacterium]
MKIKKSVFLIFAFVLSLTIFVTSTLSDTRVNSSLKLLKKVESVASDNGGKLDYDNYNEAFAVAYLTAFYEKDVREITEEEVSKEFNNIFEKKDDKFATKHISAVLESMDFDREFKNRLDHNYYGEISTLATIKSKGFYVSQNNEKYYNIAYSGDNMHISGCGPISLSIALNMVSGKSVYDAETLALWAKNNGYMDPTSGTVWSFIPDYATEQGFSVESTGIGNAKALEDYFKEGAVIITCMNRGVFTDQGHFIVWSGLDSEGNVQVVDPISIYRTNKNWPVEMMLKNSKGTFWVIKK